MTVHNYNKGTMSFDFCLAAMEFSRNDNPDGEQHFSIPEKKNIHTYHKFSLPHLLSDVLYHIGYQPGGGLPVLRLSLSSPGCAEMFSA